MADVIDLTTLRGTVDAPVIVPGIHRWLGWTPPEPDTSVDSYDEFLQSLSKEARNA